MYFGQRKLRRRSLPDDRVPLQGHLNMHLVLQSSLDRSCRSRNVAGTDCEFYEALVGGESWYASGGLAQDALDGGVTD